MKVARWTFLALFLAGSAFAQQGPPRGGPGGKAPNLDVLKNFLNLSDKQVSDLIAVQTAMRTELKPLVQDLAAKTRALRDENSKPNPDAAVVAQLKQQIAALRDQIDAKRTHYQTQARNLLTNDQVAALDKLEKALKLIGVAREAAALNLIDLPPFLGPGPRGMGAGMMGLGGPAGMAPMGPRRRGGN